MTNLTKRLQCIADEIKQGERVADIGTDHGFLPLYLYRNGICENPIMTDVSAGSLEKCREDCELAFPGTEFDLRLGDGIEVLENGEVDCVVMAGMGGNLICDIMEKNLEKSWSLKKYVLQPRRDCGRLRYWLYSHCFHITNEKLVREGRFIWPVFTAEFGERAFDPNTDKDDIEYEYPMSLVKFKNELTPEYLNTKLNLEKEKLESKKSGSLTTPKELRKQEYRVEYLEYVISKL